MTVVSNEVESTLYSYGLAVRVLSFRSARYPIGDCDTALRRNIGFWYSICPYVVGLDDDELAPANLGVAAVMLLREVPYFFGNYRFTRFAGRSVDDILAMPAALGRSREQPPNTWHSWKRCWGGIFGVRRGIVQKVGGFDLVFSGAHGGEDIGFGKRLAKNIDGLQRVFVYDPPFVWHPEEEIPWSPPTFSNLCPDGHQLERDEIRGVGLWRCRSCPYHRPDDTWKIFADEVLVPFDPDEVEVEASHL